MLTLYGTAGSGAAAVVMTLKTALERCALPFRVLRVSGWKADLVRAELRRANPLGQSPTLGLEDGSVRTENAAILIHLGLSHSASQRLPAAPGACAQAVRGLVDIAARCYAAIGVIDFPERWCVDAGPAQPDRIRQGARRRLHECWTLFADQFGGQVFQARGEPGALDLLAAAVSRWPGARAHLAEHRPAFLAFLAFPAFLAQLQGIQNHPKSSNCSTPMGAALAELK